MERERLTITLRQDILKQLDRQIDGYRLRNRSHAIEYYLNRSLGGRLTKALVLCGGAGLHLRPFTYELPKSMIPVKGRPLLAHILDGLRDQGIRDIVIAIDYLGDKIKEHFGDGETYGVKLTYVELPKPSGTAAAVRAAKTQLGNQPFLLVFGDVLANLQYQDLIDAHTDNKSAITMALTSIEDPSAFGAVQLRGSRVVLFTEKPKKDPKVSHLISAGIFVMSPKVIDAIPKKTPVSLERDVFPKLVKEGQVNGFVFDGAWYDVSTPETYERVLKEWRTE